MTTDQTDSKLITRMVLVGLVALAFVGLAVLLTSSKSQLFADEGYSTPASVYAAAGQ